MSAFLQMRLVFWKWKMEWSLNDKTGPIVYDCIVYMGIFLLESSIQTILEDNKSRVSGCIQAG